MKLYALLDETSLRAHGWSLERFVRRAVEAGADMLQYRNKTGGPEVIRERLLSIRPLFGGRLIVNDHPELAALCDGVHVGQEDLTRFGTAPGDAVARLRDIVGPDRWIGLSTHDAAEIETANRLDIDYIGLGACRATSTKDEARVLGCDTVARLAALLKHPVAAIGGVRLDDVIAHVTWRVVGSGLYED